MGPQSSFRRPLAASLALHILALAAVQPWPWRRAAWPAPAVARRAGPPASPAPDAPVALMFAAPGLAGRAARSANVPPAGNPGNKAPVFPPDAARRGEHGAVVLRLFLDASGAVVAAAILRGSGFADLDAAARAAMLRWRFTPARRDGAAVPAYHDQAADFELETGG